MNKDSRNKIKEDIIGSVSEQFSDYDHHNQKLFIQFFSAVFIVLIGYGFVFANQQILFDSITKPDGKYTVKHLLAVYIVAQIILIFLSTLILNIGYSFRRDQLKLYKIKMFFFQKDEYDNIFGDLPDNPLNKGLLKDSYLPTFNALFFRFVIFIQSVLFVSMIIVQENSSLSLDFVSNHRFTYIYILSFAILINLSEYVRFYIKYKTKVDTGNDYKAKNINFFFSLIQEGWATLIPIFILLELVMSGLAKSIFIIIVEVSSWGLFLIFLLYIFRVFHLESKQKINTSLFPDNLKS